MADVQDLYQSVLSTDLWGDIAPAFTGFLVPLAIMSLVESNTDFDTYDELYGLLIIAVAELVAPSDSKRDAQIGAGLFTANQFAERFGVQDRIIALSAGV